MLHGVVREQRGTSLRSCCAGLVWAGFGHRRPATRTTAGHPLPYAPRSTASAPTRDPRPRATIPGWPPPPVSGPVRGSFTATRVRSPSNHHGDEQRPPPWPRPAGLALLRPHQRRHHRAVSCRNGRSTSVALWPARGLRRWRRARCCRPVRAGFVLISASGPAATATPPLGAAHSRAPAAHPLAGGGVTRGSAARPPRGHTATRRPPTWGSRPRGSARPDREGAVPLPGCRPRRRDAADRPV